MYIIVQLTNKYIFVKTQNDVKTPFKLIEYHSFVYHQTKNVKGYYNHLMDRSDFSAAVAAAHNSRQR